MSDEISRAKEWLVKDYITQQQHIYVARDIIASLIARVEELESDMVRCKLHLECETKAALANRNRCDELERENEFYKSWWKSCAKREDIPVIQTMLKDARRSAMERAIASCREVEAGPESPHVEWSLACNECCDAIRNEMEKGE